MLHEQAIYQHDGEQYQVEQLDYENHKAFVRKVEPDYFTDAMTYTRGERARGGSGAAPRLGDGAAVRAGARCRVVEKVVGYKKIKFHTHENAGYGDVRLPEMQMHTTAFWLTVPEAVVRAHAVPRPAVIDALRGLGHALHTVASVGLMIDPRDLGHTLGDRKTTRRVRRARARAAPGFDPTLFLYDHVPGGVGLRRGCSTQREELLRPDANACSSAARARRAVRHASARCSSRRWQPQLPDCRAPRVFRAAEISLAVLADLGLGPTH